jgi:hypothetical protein
VYWKNAIPPALLGALYYVIGREIMRWHMYQNPDANMSESLLLVLVWFYYSNIAFVYASEFARLYISKKQNINYNDLTNIQ